MADLVGGINLDLQDIEDRFSYLGVPIFYKFKHSKDLENVDAALVGVPFDQRHCKPDITRYSPV